MYFGLNIPNGEGRTVLDIVAKAIQDTENKIRTLSPVTSPSLERYQAYLLASYSWLKNRNAKGSRKVKKRAEREPLSDFFIG